MNTGIIQTCGKKGKQSLIYGTINIIWKVAFGNCEFMKHSQERKMYKYNVKFNISQ